MSRAWCWPPTAPTRTRCGRGRRCGDSPAGQPRSREQGSGNGDHRSATSGHKPRTVPKQLPLPDSDAAYAELESDEDLDLGEIAKPTAIGETDVNPEGTTFSISRENAGISVGDTVYFIGRTSGWNEAQVTDTCAFSEMKALRGRRRGPHSLCGPGRARERERQRRQGRQRCSGGGAGFGQQCRAGRDSIFR